MFSKGYVHVLISFLYLGDEEDYGTDSESDSDCSTDLSSEYQKKKHLHVFVTKAGLFLNSNVNGLTYKFTCTPCIPF